MFLSMLLPYNGRECETTQSGDSLVSMKFPIHLINRFSNASPHFYVPSLPLNNAFHFLITKSLVLCFKPPAYSFCNILQNCDTKGKRMSQVSKAESRACAACKFQKKKCSDKCVLSPYFPPNDPHKFLLVHGLFGYGHVLKLLQNLPAEQRGDAVSSLVYEAKARVADPVHGCVALINDLHKKLEELQSRLASTQAELDNVMVRHDNLYSLITGCHEGWDLNFYSALAEEIEDLQYSNLPVLDDDMVCSLQLPGDPYLDREFATSKPDDSAACP